MVTKLDPETDKGNCLICGREVMWITKSYGEKFPSKKTLRNADDQQAHNVKDGVDDNGKPRWTCSKDSSSGFAGTYQSTPKEPYEYKILTDEEQELYKAIIDKVCEYDILGDDEITKFPVDQSGMSKGRIKNISGQVLRDILKQKREES